MLKRLLSAVSLVILMSATAHAAARNPQVPVSGTALQNFFASQGQTIDVHNQQLDLQTISLPMTAAFEVHTFGAGGVAFGSYNAPLATPSLYPIAPGASLTGWFAAASFRSAPMRMVVNLFDATDAIQGTTTYVGADPTSLGFYDQGSTGPFYTQDARNPGGEAKILAYNGTGSLTGWTWFACETGAGPGGDYADLIALVNLSLAPTPVLQTNWGTLKRRFR